MSAHYPHFCGGGALNSDEATILDSQRSQATSAPGEPVIAIIHPKEKGKDGGAKR